MKKPIISVGKPNPRGYFNGKITTASTKSSKPNLGGKGRTDFSPLAGYAGGSQGSSYAMRGLRGDAHLKKGNGMLASLTGYHKKRGK